MRFFWEMADVRFPWPLLFLSLAFSLCSLSPIHSQGWQNKPFFDNYDFAKDGHPTPDGGFIICGETGPNNDLHKGYLLKLDPFGNEQWRRLYGGASFDAFDDMEPTDDGGYLLAGTTFSFATGGGFDAWLVKVNRFGDVEWQQVYGGPGFEFARQVIHTSDGGYAMTGRYENGPEVGILVIKTDGDGNQEWLEVFGGADVDEGWSITENIDNQLIIAASTASFGAGERDIYIGTVSLDGTFLGFQTFGGADDELGTNVIATSDGGLLIAGATRSFGAGDYDVILLKTNADASVVDWQQTYGGTEGEWGAYLLELPDGYAFSGSAQSFGNLLDDIYLVRTNLDGDLIWQRTFGGERKDIPHSIAATPDGGFIVAGHSRVDTMDAIETSRSFLIQANSEGIAYSNFFQGKIFDDLNGDCLPDAGEEGFENWILTARKDDGTTFYGNTKADGSYSILTDTGTYVLILTPPNTYWEPCENALPFSMLSVDDTVTYDFPLQKTNLCPWLEVDLATSLVTPCENSKWQVRYGNHGTATATDAFVEITLDSFLTFVSSSLPVASQNGLTYRFDLGDLEPGEMGNFSLTATLDCEVEIGRTHCLDARIFPNDNCFLPPSPMWDGASLEVRSRCLGDSVEFVVKNIGAGDMAEAHEIIIVEDQIIGLVIDVDLGSGDSLTIVHPAFGKTIRLETKQTSNHPGRSRPTVTEEGCHQSAPDISKGFQTMFFEDDADEFKSIDCRESIENLPKDEKLSFPKGVGSEHLIPPGIDIEYLIPFQNTGNDTVDNVVVRDTLSPFLDWTSLRAGAASHPYELTVSNTGVLQFTFENIDLPDSLTNAAESRGYVKFRVSQLPDLPADSVIENRSCVYFDFGGPAAKPHAFHTVDKPKVFSISDVSLCTGGIYDGVVISSDTTFFALNELPLVDSFSLSNIMALPIYHFEFSDSTCANDEYDWLGEILTQPGIYDSLLMTTAGCDSSLTLTLAHLDVPTSSFVDTTCANEPYIFGSQILTETGLYEEYFSALNGCDSIVTLSLEVTPLGEFPVDTAVAVGGEFMGNIIFSDTLILDTVPYELGCDILVMWNVSIYNSTKDIFDNGEIKINPNPAFDELIISWKNISTPIESISIFNSIGNKLTEIKKESFANNDFHRIDLRNKNWPTGIYYILLRTENRQFVKRVLIGAP